MTKLVGGTRFIQLVSAPLRRSRNDLTIAYAHAFARGHGLPNATCATLVPLSRRGAVGRRTSESGVVDHYCAMTPIVTRSPEEPVVDVTCNVTTLPNTEHETGYTAPILPWIVATQVDTAVGN